ncbi:E4 SUMO-protein ligase PIAL2-like isoform X1 [Cucurbita maxima]|uniref:E4 SUMO-protein ligase PIAL2-like isoform X1 n=1 Tax=Cucurbita maxima TaxID=3661 RepID=A0A6J1HXV3_CUCMA|nr:E4 SUMO-protein ligase PIAL2-like isoform X1 [Cucurbita maxima]
MGATTPYEMKLDRISSYIDSLTLYVNRVDQIDPVQLCNICFSLARSIDFAIANDFVPSKAQGLPSLLKQICQKKHSHHLKAAIMVLMIAAKNACKVKWFSEKEAEELYSLANEIGSDFFVDTNTGPSNSLTTITKVMERFFPRLKLGQIVISAEVKPGYGVFAFDFNISKTIQYAPQEKIRLFVAQKDNTETSACIISPPQLPCQWEGSQWKDKYIHASFLFNKDTGPQLPTNVTHMLKLGSNLLQVIGSFNGHYVISVAVMGSAPSPDSSVLQDHEQPAVSTVDSDSDIIEGPSRISLNCPISYTRIKVPVKGRSCKHLQCFDFYNFIDINSRRPSWRCPHCNQYICFLDICIDQNMLKVIREVAENVTEVIISADGSWKAILENDCGDGRPLDDSLNQQNERAQQESTAPPDVLDLTEVDDDMNICNLETEDRKPCLGNKNQPVSSSLNILSGMNRNSLNQNFSAALDDDFWSRMVTDRLLTSSIRSDAPMGSSTAAPSFAGLTQSAGLTDAVSPVLNHDVGVPGQVNFPFPSFYDQNNVQVQVSNSNESNQYGRMTSIARPVSRTLAGQVLPAQSQTSGQQYSSRTSTVSSAPQVGQSIPISRDGLNTISRDSEMRQPFPRHHGDLHHATNLAPFLRPPIVQNREPQDRSFTPGQSVRASTAQRPSVGILTDFQNPHLQQALNLRISHLQNQNPSSVRPSLPFSRPTSQVGGGYGGSAYTAVTPHNQHARMMVASQRAEMMRQSSAMSLQNQTSRSPHPLQTTPDGLRRPAGELRNVGGMTQSVTMASNLLDPSVEQNRQPIGRMRGSLSGRAYSDAFGVIIQPTQPVQSARPPSNLTTTQSSAPSTHAQRSNGFDTVVPRT